MRVDMASIIQSTSPPRDNSGDNFWLSQVIASRRYADCIKYDNDYTLSGTPDGRQAMNAEVLQSHAWNYTNSASRCLMPDVIAELVAQYQYSGFRRTLTLSCATEWSSDRWLLMHDNRLPTKLKLRCCTSVLCVTLDGFLSVILLTVMYEKKYWSRTALHDKEHLECERRQELVETSHKGVVINEDDHSITSVSVWRTLL